ncbi:MAG: hypothetical protein ACLGHP_05305, partial [Vicinamibacteria bacterium]
MAARLRLVGQRAREGVAARVAGCVEGEQQQRAAVGRHPLARVPQLVDGERVVVDTGTSLGPPVEPRLVAEGAAEHPGHVRLEVGLHARVLRVQRGERARPVLHAPVLDAAAGAPGLEQPVERVGRHERVRCVGAPPAPAAVVLLVVVEPPQALGYLPIERAEPLGEVLARRLVPASISVDNQTERVQAEMVSGNYFSVLGVQPALGRVFSSAEDDQVHEGHPVVVLGH